MNLVEYERKVYSQFTEDGILLELVRRLNPHKYFVEIGAGNNGENCTHILVDYDWRGIWIDAKGEELAKTAWHPNVCIEQAFITVDNISEYLESVPREIGVLSIDIDGNDYWLWRQICGTKDPLRPSIVIIESQIQKPFDEPYIMPYQADYVWDDKSQDCGASIHSLVELGKEMGYHFVGKCPDYHSPNLFFVRAEFKDVVD